MRRIISVAVRTSIGGFGASLAAVALATPACAGPIEPEGAGRVEQVSAQPQQRAAGTQQGSTWTQRKAVPPTNAVATAAPGRLLVDSGRNLTSVTAAGTEARTLVVGTTLQRRYASYAVDGKHIFYSDFGSTGAGTQLWRMKADGTDRRQLTKLPNPVGCVRTAPDGKTVAFQIRTGEGAAIWVSDINGGNPRQVTKSGGYYGPCPSWSRDSKRFVVTRGDVDPRSGEPFNWDIYSVRADRSGETRLTRTGGDKNGPALSPDNSRIVFSYVSAEGMRAGQPYDLWSMKADGTGARQITRTPNASEQDPVWAPNGSQIVYAHAPLTSSTPRIWRATPDGSATQDTGVVGYPTAWK